MQLTTNNGQLTRSGFTLIELLVVILIILLVSAVALPAVLPALSHRQVSEAARLLQGALVGARDSAIHNQVPSGFRLLPDPAFPLHYVTVNGFTQIDPTQPMAANRMIPLEQAPQYSEGMVSSFSSAAVVAAMFPPDNLPLGTNSLVVQESVVAFSAAAGGNQPNAPTSWFWNIRVGDKIQINNAGPWYTVVGPMAIPPQGTTINGVFYANTEMFVNVGPPGTQSPLSQLQGAPTLAVNPEYLFLVNGQDDNNNGWIDEGFDGVDNNTNGATDELIEWEAEAWLGSLHISPTFSNELYTIQRRPAPGPNSRELALPTNVVIDMTTWFTTQERSRLPVNHLTGYVDIMVYPNGTVLPTTIYSTPASFGMAGAFFQFWLAERNDVLPVNVDPNTGLPVPLVANQPLYLPVGAIHQQLASSNPYTGPSLQGEYRIVSLFTRTGQITTSDNVQFDNPLNPANGTKYNPGFPFLAAQQGIRGGP